MIFVSYYTKKTPYEKVIKTHLLPSLRKFGCKYDIKGIEDRGNWARNTGYKAEFMKEMLEKHRQGVIFLDADATLVRRPVLFDKIPRKYDIAVHYLDWYYFWRGQKGNQRRDLLSGTMMFRYSEKALDLCDKYIYRVNSNIKQWEQKTLQNVVEEEKERGLQVYNLPIEYVSIKKRNGKVPIKKPVIVHHQKSREYKK